MESSSLPPAPARLVHARGVPAFGMYQGRIETLSWQRLKTPTAKRLTRRLHHKRWQYAGIAHTRFFVGLAIVDAGWTSAAFAYLFDRDTRQVAASASANGLPGTARLESRPFGTARFRHRRLTLDWAREGERLVLAVDAPGLCLAAHVHLPADAPVMAAIAPANWLAHSTHKTGALEISGFVDTGRARYSLDGAHASLDASDGLLARNTAWQWASAHRPDIGFNLQAGFMGDAENALWIDGELFRAGVAHFNFEQTDPMRPWTIRTDDGCLDLVFTPEGMRREDRNYWLAASRYVQPVGTFSGTVVHPLTGARRWVEGLTGVTEDHASRW
ncbi:DUF2804 domain-containing protein [Gulbenkiania mobilis]|uniref:DUF2804 domain-containing protein n=1 Tax=Gulbenkiania mobilis TaxID=397457 RepID=UPI0006BBED22|nr:DUF2804 domain-containing protein [Gulbenkiania mobilis]